MKDALGRDLIIGQTYGYSRSENGVTTVKVGKLVKINKQMVTLEVAESKWAVYTNELTNRKPGRAISVKANGLFPVDDYWERRCKAAEKCLDYSPIPANEHQHELYLTWKSLVKERP
jgi:hypothetical protein